jgi:hypothetical protein
MCMNSIVGVVTGLQAGQLRNHLCRASTKHQSHLNLCQLCCLLNVLAFVKNHHQANNNI